MTNQNTNETTARDAARSIARFVVTNLDGTRTLGYNSFEPVRGQFWLCTGVQGGDVSVVAQRVAWNSWSVFAVDGDLNPVEGLRATAETFTQARRALAVLVDEAARD